MASTATASPRITRDDLEAKIREMEGGARDQAESVKVPLLAAGGVLAVLLALVVFALGRRAGKQRTTVVEIKRV